MIAIELQDDLIEELQDLFRNEKFKNESYDPTDETSQKYVPIRMFSQDLPIESSREDDEDNHFPYLIVKLDSGKMPDETSAHEVKVVILIGIFDDSNNNQGHRDVLHIINMIYERFAKKPMLKHQYVAKMPFEWALQDENVHPYFFGGIEMSFDIPAVRREDELA